MKYPLEIEGEQRGAQLMIVGFPNEPPLKFRIGILGSRDDLQARLHGRNTCKLFKRCHARQGSVNYQGAPLSFVGS